MDEFGREEETQAGDLGDEILRLTKGFARRSQYSAAFGRAGARW